MAQANLNSSRVKMPRGIKGLIRNILGIMPYDRKAEYLIYRSIELYHKGDKISRFRAIRLYNRIRKTYCCNIWPGIEIGTGAYIAHAHDVCIGKTAVIGNNCRFYPHSDITAGVVHDKELISGKQRRHAQIGNDCLLGNGAVIVGAVTVGNDVTIGAGALVTKDVPSHTVVKGVNDFRAKRLDEIPESYIVDGQVID